MPLMQSLLGHIPLLSLTHPVLDIFQSSPFKFNQQTVTNSPPILLPLSK